jgi:hypothetical protein
MPKYADGPERDAGSFKDLRVLDADDVLNDSRSWREISRDEAMNSSASDRVIVVYRNGGDEYADWFVRGHPLFLGVGPHSLRGVRYYRYQDQPRVRGASTAPVGAAAQTLVARGPADTPKQPAHQPPPPPVTQRTWIEIELVNEMGAPVVNERYTIRLPDGSTRDGTLDTQGRARLDEIDPGTCKICFPAIDQEAWRPA